MTKLEEKHKDVDKGFDLSTEVWNWSQMGLNFHKSALRFYTCGQAVFHTSSMSLKSYCINAHVSDMCCCGIIDPHQINTNNSDNYQLPCWPLFYWHWLCESAEQYRADVCKRRNLNRSNWDWQTISSTTHLLLWHSYACQGGFTRSYINTSHGTALWIWVIVTIATKQKKIPWHEWNTWACPIKCKLYFSVATHFDTMHTMEYESGEPLWW